MELAVYQEETHNNIISKQIWLCVKKNGDERDGEGGGGGTPCSIK